MSNGPLLGSLESYDSPSFDRLEPSLGIRSGSFLLSSLMSLSERVSIS